VGLHDLFINEGAITLGHRRCPNPDCRALIFFVDQGGEITASYPPETFDFDPENIPHRIREALQEAIACHAIGQHVAAAMMVRKTLEEVCREEEAKGDNLKARLEALRDRVVLPKDLLDSLDDLRLLGNDAAHVRARVYDTIGKVEVDLSLEITKEILKGLYQLSSLVKRLQALKRRTEEDTPQP
jgi:hypothetical protein